ncbi:MAG: LamG-like jellyroll fold domain-containing protein, partial [Verrucomicrobiota bacterium]
DKILINDPDDDRAVKAFQNSTATNHNHPYIAEIRPQPGSKGIPANDTIEILLIDDGAAVDQNSIQLFRNELEITGDADISRSNGRTSISYQPNPSRAELNNDLRLVYNDTAGRSFEKVWGFEITEGEGVTKITGQWDFDNGDLAATVGRDLEYLSDTVREGTEFGTTASLGIPSIDGEVANVMVVPEPEGRGDRDIGYVMYHGLEPNGGGTRVNQYTLLMDVMLFEGASGAAGMIQIDSPRPTGDNIPNSGDSDFFWQNGNMGQGQGGYVGDGSFTPFEWHRIVFAVDLAANPRVVTKYVDGVKQHDWVQNSLDQPRRALLDEYSILFTDGDADEQSGWYVNSVQIREGKMPDVEIELLGGPTAEGFPASQFDDPNATVSRRNVFGDLDSTDPGPQTRRIAVYNSGESKDLVIESVTPTGPEAAFFRVVEMPDSLASAEQGTIIVEFDPGEESGLFEAALEIATNDGGDAVISVDISARVDNPSGLVAHYKMDETEGDQMLDSSGQRYHGTYGSAGTGSFTLGEAGLATGGAVKFSDGGSPADGGGGFGQLDAEASIPSLQNMTISMWVQPDAADQGASMLLAKGTAAGDPFALATNAIGDDNPLLWFVQENPVIESSPVLSVGETQHVVITHLDENGLELGSTRTRIYVNGELVEELEEGDGYEDLAPSVIQIGALNGGFGFTGTIDDTQIYSRELSAEDVQFLFENPGESVAPPAMTADFYPIANVSSSTVDFFAVENLVQGPGVGFNAASPFEKLISGQDGNWVTDAPGGFPADYIDVAGEPVIVLDLGEDVPLGEVSVWGYDSGNANGASAFGLRFATDADGDGGFGSSISFNPAFEPISNEDSDARQSFAFEEVVIARYVEFTITDNHFIAPGDGSGGETPGGDRTGLGEIAFEVTAPPVLSDVTNSQDPVFIFNGEDDGDGAAGIPPGPEGVSNAINDVGQKYLNFLDLGSGFTVSPAAGLTVVTGLRLYPANDAVERDPASYELWGSLGDPQGDDFVLISEGPLDLPTDRNAGGGLVIQPSLPHQEVRFANANAYTSYRLVFPTLRDSESANSMQIAEVEFLGMLGDGGEGNGYSNDFTYDDGTTDLGDGSIIASNDGTNSVQGGALQMTLAGTNSTASSFVLPPMDMSGGWTTTFDFVIEHTGENTPADGFSFNYGAIPEGENFGDPAEEGYGDATPHVSFQVDTWLWNDAAGQDAG